MGVAVLVQQTLLRGETRPKAVDLDRTAFEHDQMVEDGDSEKRSDFLGDLLVLFIRLVLAAPPVEDAIVESRRPFHRISNHKRRPLIPHPPSYRSHSAAGYV